LGLSAPASFADITSDVRLQADLASLYGSVTEIDPLVAMLAEDRASGSLFGETTHALYGLQFSAIRDGDRLWHQVRLNADPTLRSAIRAVGLSIAQENGTWQLDRSLASLLPHTATIGDNGDVTRLHGGTHALTVMDSVQTAIHVLGGRVMPGRRHFRPNYWSSDTIRSLTVC
jgi:hypothetical protein